MIESKQEKGFLTIAQNNASVDYVRLAYGLALSIKASQNCVNDISIGVTPGYEIPEKYRWVFDEVIEMPWGDMAARSRNKFENEWKVIHMSPYERTIKIEADMLINSDIGHYWDAIENDLFFTSNVYNYRNELITSRYCRNLFDQIKLPDIYNGLMYFEKSETCYAFFKMAERIFSDWKTFYNEFFGVYNPGYVSTDHVYALAAKLLGIDNEVFSKDVEVPKFVHMKYELMNWERKTKDRNWIDNVAVYLNDDLELKVGNYKQVLPFHYHEKKFLTDEMIRKYEGKVK